MQFNVTVRVLVNTQPFVAGMMESQHMELAFVNDNVMIHI